MAAILELYRDQFLIFLLVLTRVSGLVMVAPLFGSRAVPLQVRGVLSVSLAALVAVLLWDASVPHPNNLVALLVLMAGEAILGLSLGLAVLILVSGLQLSGAVIGQMSGMQLAEVADPATNSPIPVFSQLLNLVALAVFVTMDGHRMVMEALLETFRWMPVGSGRLTPDIVQTLTQVAAMSFRLAVKAAAPVAISLMLSMLIMGLISRTLPQLNVLAVGFSLNAVIALLALSAAIGSAAWLFEQHAREVLALMRSAFASANP